MKNVLETALCKYFAKTVPLTGKCERDITPTTHRCLRFPVALYVQFPAALGMGLERVKRNGTGLIWRTLLDKSVVLEWGGGTLLEKEAFMKCIIWKKKRRLTRNLSCTEMKGNQLRGQYWWVCVADLHWFLRSVSRENKCTINSVKLSILYTFLQV